MFQAVILAAGRGTRLGQITESVPKALLPLGQHAAGEAEDTCFLRRHIELLHALGAATIVVVAGFKHEKVRQAIAAWNVDVRIVVNPKLDHGSLYSFLTATETIPSLLDGRTYTVLMDADIVYHRNILELMLKNPADSAILVSENVVCDGEEVLVFGTPLHPVFIGKAPSAACRMQAECIGEATGIVGFAPGDHAAVKRTMNTLLDEAAGRWIPGVPVEHEELTQKLIEQRNIRCIPFSADIPFIEVDTPSEYQAARERYYPAILRMEDKHGNSN